MARLFYPNKKVSASVGAFLVIAVILVFNIVVNLAKFPYVDASPTKIHTLSPETLEIIENIDAIDPIYIDFYYTPDALGLPREIKEAGQEVLRILKLYNKAAGNRIIVSQYGPNPLSSEKEEQAIVEQAHQYGIKRFEKYWNKSTVIVYCGLVIRRADRKYVFDNIDDELISQLQLKISTGIDYCISSQRKKLGIISGMDFREKRAHEKDKEFIPEWPILTRLKEIFDVEFLEQPAKQIEKCDVLLVIQPHNLSDEDFQAIDQHVLQGKGALFCQSPFSFLKLVLISQELQILEEKVERLSRREAQKIIDKAEERLVNAMDKDPQAQQIWKQLKQVPPVFRRQLFSEFQKKLQANYALAMAYQDYQREGQRAMMIVEGEASLPPANPASKILQELTRKIAEKSKEDMSKGQLINSKLFRKWGFQLMSHKMVFSPTLQEKPKVPNLLAQYKISIDADSTPKSFAQNRLETQNLKEFHPNFTGVFERVNTNEKVQYVPLVRVDKQFSFFVPNPRAKIKNWFRFASFEKFIHGEKMFAVKNGERWNNWVKAMGSKGDQLSGWYDIAIAVEGTFPSAFPGGKLKETKEGVKSRIVAIASCDLLDRDTSNEWKMHKQITTHDFIIALLQHLSLRPELASLTKSGSKYRFDVLEQLKQKAEKKAHKERNKLARERQKNRTAATKKYNAVIKKHKRKKGYARMAEGFIVPVEFVDPRERIELKAAEDELNQSLQEIKQEEKKNIEQIEYKVANATKVKKGQVRLIGTIVPPCLILLLGILAYFFTQASRKD